MADWLDPATGNLTIDDHRDRVCDQSRLHDRGRAAKGWGDVNHLAVDASWQDSITFAWRPTINRERPAIVRRRPRSERPAGVRGRLMAHLLRWLPGGIAGLPSDSVIPGAVLSFLVTGANGDFMATWNDPATGYDNRRYGNQWVRDPSSRLTCGDSGWLGRAKPPGVPIPSRRTIPGCGTQPVRCSSTPTRLSGATGWGPWTAFGAAVSSGTIPALAGIDRRESVSQSQLRVRRRRRRHS